MKRKKMVIGNWKMNLNLSDAKKLAEKIGKDIKKSSLDIYVCPSFVEIIPVYEKLKDTTIGVGAQNVSENEKGSYTGEVSILSFNEIAEVVLVGHSERRRYFGETDKIIAQKADLVARHGAIPIICVGETLHEREDGLSKVVTLSQLEASCKHLTKEEVAQSVIAYEPVWAIGSGKNCSKKDAEEVVKEIRGMIKALYGEEVSEKVRVLYGGSVDSKNVSDFASSKLIDGVLVGGASLDGEEFKKIVESFEK